MTIIMPECCCCCSCCCGIMQYCCSEACCFPLLKTAGIMFGGTIVFMCGGYVTASTVECCCNPYNHEKLCKQCKRCIPCKQVVVQPVEDGKPPPNIVMVRNPTGPLQLGTVCECDT